MKRNKQFQVQVVVGTKQNNKQWTNKGVANTNWATNLHVLQQVQQG